MNLRDLFYLYLSRLLMREALTRLGRENRAQVIFLTKIHLLVFSLKYENIREANLSFFVLNALLAKNTNSAAGQGLSTTVAGGFRFVHKKIIHK